MKKITITEEQFKMITENAVGETTRRQKAEKAVNNTNKHVRTYAILTANNPMTEPLPKAYNDRLNEKLKAYLKTGNFVWFPVKGHYGTQEDSFIVYNISLSDALHLGEKFEQESIIWCDNETGEKQYWEQNGNGEFSKTHVRKNITDMSDADDLYTKVSKNKKFQIPFFDGNDEELNEMLSKHGEIIEKAVSRNLTRYNEGERFENYKLGKILSENVTQKAKWEARGTLYCGYQKFM